MGSTATVDGVQMLVSKAGKQYHKLSIGGGEFLAFGKSSETVSRSGVQAGDTVEYSFKPTDKGDANMITFIKKAGASTAPAPGAGSPAAIVGSATPRPAYTGRSADPTMQMSIFYGYAKDLVAAGIVKTTIGGPEAVADLVATVAEAIMRKFKMASAPDTGPGSSTKPPATPEALNPQ